MKNCVFRVIPYFQNQRPIGQRLLLAVMLCGSSLVAASRCAHGEEPVITRIEEDWVLVVRNPNLAKTAPQLLNVISPIPNLSGQYAILEVNHATQPQFSAGGLQLQAWKGETLTAFHPSICSASLRFDNETIRYTIVMDLQGGKLTVEVKDGSSDTWGTFGSKAYLKTHMASSLSDLGQYSPQFSADQSRVGYGGKRVGRFYLDRTRYFSDSSPTPVRTDETDRRSPADPED